MESALGELKSEIVVYLKIIKFIQVLLGVKIKAVHFCFHKSLLLVTLHGGLWIFNQYKLLKSYLISQHSV